MPCATRISVSFLHKRTNADLIASDEPNAAKSSGKNNVPRSEESILFLMVVYALLVAILNSNSATNI